MDNISQRPRTVAERRFAEVREQLRGRPASEIFDFIHRENLWGSPESSSGVGSQLDATARVRAELPGLLKKLGVKTLLDIPCGDFSWLSNVPLPIEHYLGGDIVPSIIEHNAARFKHSHPFARFCVFDLSKDALPVGDVLFCRDCLVHLPDSSIVDVFQNISRSRIRYVILTTFTAERVNVDIEPGDWRPLNLERPPFSLPPPEAVLLEECTEERGAYADKVLGVWSVEALRERFSTPGI